MIHATSLAKRAVHNAIPPQGCPANVAEILTTDTVKQKRQEEVEEAEELASPGTGLKSRIGRCTWRRRARRRRRAISPKHHIRLFGGRAPGLEDYLETAPSWESRVPARKAPQQALHAQFHQQCWHPSESADRTLVQSNENKHIDGRWYKPYDEGDPLHCHTAARCGGLPWRAGPPLGGASRRSRCPPCAA